MNATEIHKMTVRLNSTRTFKGEAPVNAVKEFCLEALSVAVAKITGFVSGVYKHIETISVLVLASLGLNALLSEIPFFWTLPLWIESPMVIPVLAVLGVFLLVKLGERRAIKRMVIA